MYKEDELIRLRSIQTKFNSIFTIIKRHDGIVNALEDEEGQPAILMLLIASAEHFNKLSKYNSAIISEFDEEDIKGIISVRNFIAHDYDGVNLAMIESDLRINIPKILKIIESILKNEK